MRDFLHRRPCEVSLHHTCIHINVLENAAHYINELEKNGKQPQIQRNELFIY